MYIKQILIQGFKSYKEQTVTEPFSAGHNAVVGRNGSGKSNFFWAIRFVLGDAYGNMTREERQALLHEGTGPATISAFVQVVFDNSDNRFPTGKPEVTLRRTIGLKKDEYSLDRKSVTKSEVMNLLESAGFSRSNPYYIVPQGRITTLTNAKDHERLHVLKEVAGTKVYEQRRQESVKIMEETKMKQGKIGELLAYINERLSELDEEKAELDQYQKAEKERRCLEYSLYFQEQNDAAEALAELDMLRQNEIESNLTQFNELSDREQSIQNMEEELQTTSQELRLLTAERQQVDDEHQEFIRVKTELELTLTDIQESSLSRQNLKSDLLAEQSNLETQIAQKSLELANVMPQFDTMTVVESELRATLEQAMSDLTTLQSEAGRATQFKSAADRDQWLKPTIQRIQASVEEELVQISGLKNDILLAQTRSAEIANEVAAEKSTLAQSKEEMEAGGIEFNALRRKRENLEVARKNLWKEEATLSSALENARDDVQKSERILFGTMDRAVSSGLKSVKKITERLRLEGVYGPLYELFSVDDRYRCSVEVIASSSLFHVVVDTDETATKILHELSREGGGRVTFMPLNRLRTLEQSYPPKDQAIPMIEKLQFDAFYSKAFRQVFGRAIICPSLELASGFAQSHNLTAVTLDGDRADRKGALSGGFRDHRHSRLEATQKLKLVAERQIQSEARLADVKSEIRKHDQLITQARDDISRLDTRRRELMNIREPLNATIQGLAREELDIKEILVQRNRSLAKLQSSINGLQAQITSYEAELGTPLRNSLSRADQIRLEKLLAEVKENKPKLARIVEQRVELEGQCNILTIELNSNLKRRLADISAKYESLLGGNEDPVEVDGHLAKLDKMKVLEDKAANRLQEIDDDLDHLKLEAARNTETLDRLRVEKNESAHAIELQQHKMEKFMNRRSLLLKKKDDALSNIRDLGVLPDEAFVKYQNTNPKVLIKKLHKVNESLKTFGHVNKKAFEQYNNFAIQKEQLQERKEELDQSHQAIEELITVLDQRKDEAIEQTFHQVAQNFSDVWSKIVPDGQGQLIMLRRTDEASDTLDATQEYSLQADRREQLRESSIEQYTGIAINVSFSSKTDEGRRMPQLSGGQKSLVALALIFAIQRSDPAPFYLFDEIDAALDAQYRTAIADMVHELSEHAQFITTTFRPELLEHADKCYGVIFVDKVSRIQCISKDEARQFVDGAAQ
ncbi:hypothetical protein BASA83_005766 [Batrachochytrium salamandrivorans]|nr:hypothetical protein BASA83_005766 [Batrachochytrium salamandrivorans]